MDAIKEGLQHLVYGRYKIAVSRRVTDEEVVSITGFFRRPRAMQDELKGMLEHLRNHMLAYNQQVVRAHQEEIRSLNRTIADKQGELSDLQAQIEQAKVKIARVK